MGKFFSFPFRVVVPKNQCQAVSWGENKYNMMKVCKSSFFLGGAIWENNDIQEYSLYLILEDVSRNGKLQHASMCVDLHNFLKS